MPPSKTDSDMEIQALEASLVMKKQVWKDALEAKMKAMKDKVSGRLADW